MLCIGERPGQDEDRDGVPFIGKSGQELNKVYIPSANLYREQCLVTNAVQCAHATNETPTDEQIRVCSEHHLPQLIAECDPELIILVGGSAHKLIKQWSPTQFKPLDTVHGFPIHLHDPATGYRSWVASTYHPARALRDTKFMAHCINDWKRIGLHLAGKFTSPTPPFPAVVTSLITSTGEIDYAFRQPPIMYRDLQLVGIDTESHKGPFSLQFSASAGVGWMILADRLDLLQYLSTMYLPHVTVVYHNAIHDLREAVALGVTTPRYIDTMQLAYHLCDQPQKLKALAWRLLGATMRSWEDVVLPASVNALLDWLAEANEIAERDLTTTETVPYKRPYRGKLSKEVVTQSKSVPVFSRIAKHVQNNDEYDPWERMDAYRLAYQEDYTHIENRLGSCPTLGIRNAKLADAIEYGCSDAIYTAVLPQALYDLRFDDRGKDKFEIAIGDEDKL